MLQPVTLRILVLAACGWLLACEASALTLGRARGAVLVGRPLELSIPVSLDAADADGPCADGELFYGEQKQARPPTVRWEAGANRQGVLRVSSPQVVDEPMVTLYLRVGCDLSVTRRFVVLAELPPEVEPTVPLVTLPQRLPRASRPRADPQAVPQAAPQRRPGAEDPPDTSAPAPAPLPRRRRERAAAEAPAPAPVLRQARKAADPPVEATSPRLPRLLRQRALADERDSDRPRLRIDLLDLAPERDPTLRMSTEMGPIDTVDSQAREAASALWQAVRRGPEEQLQEALKLQALERDLQSLRLVTQQNAASVAQMRRQVEQGGGERTQSSGLVVAMLAALAALLAWIVWQWRRSTASGTGIRWFERKEAASPPAPAPAPAPLAGDEEYVVREMDDAPSIRGEFRANVATTVQTAKPTARGSDLGEYQTGVGGLVRMVGAPELIDVHDKADFFLALGQQDQAVAVLEAHVHDQVETSPLAWMDLLGMYHSLGKRKEYVRLRSEFRKRFSVQVPDFDHFNQPSSSLENYGRALSRIVALWPSRRVLSIIEESIFRNPALPGAELFSLEAYRELVLLYNIAQEVAPPEDGQSVSRADRPADFPTTTLQPLDSLDTRPPAMPDETPEEEPDEVTVVMGRVEHQTERERLMIPPSSSRIGLDIDLDAPVEDEPMDLPDPPVAAAVDPDAPFGAAWAAAAAAPGVGPAATEPTSAKPSRPEMPPLDFDTSATDDLPSPDAKPKGN